MSSFNVTLTFINYTIRTCDLHFWTNAEINIQNPKETYPQTTMTWIQLLKIVTFKDPQRKYFPITKYYNKY